MIQRLCIVDVWKNEGSYPWWYIHVRLWVELLVTQGLMQVDTPNSRKHQHRAKATKMVTPPHIIVV